MNAVMKSAAAELSGLPARRTKTRPKMTEPLHLKASRSRESTSSLLLSRRGGAVAASPAGMCFDAACQDTQDHAFVAAVLFPLAASLAAGAFVWNQPSRSLPSGSSSSGSPLPSPSSDKGSSPPPPSDSTTETTTEPFEDPSTGIVFEPRPGEKPPRETVRGNSPSGLFRSRRSPSRKAPPATGSESKSERSRPRAQEPMSLRGDCLNPLKLSRSRWRGPLGSFLGSRSFSEEKKNRSSSTS